MKKILFLYLSLVVSLLCSAQNVRVHQVVRGESLEYIAQKYGVTVEEIMQHNLLLDKYFYVGQKLNIPIKEQPKVEASNYTYSSSSWEEKPVKKRHRNNGWKQFWGDVFSGFVAGATGYGQPMMYNPSFQVGGSGNMNYLLDPNYALMQLQPQMAQMQEAMKMEWESSQKAQQMFQSQNQINPWQSVPQGTAVWSNMPVITETPVFEPSTTNNTSTGHQTVSHTCPLCHGNKTIVHESNVATYGKDTQRYCSTCGRNYWASSGHSHITCTQCHGKGYF